MPDFLTFEGLGPAQWKAPPKRGLGATGDPARRRHRAASFGEWHHTTPELRRLQFAPATDTGDIRTVARNFARWRPGTEAPVLRNPDAISTPASAVLQRHAEKVVARFLARPKNKRLPQSPV